jgi:membrane protease YdiL (CAAX protease family)
MGLLPAAIVVGLIWGLWHLPPDYIALKGYGDWFWLAFLINGPLILTGHSIIMAWLWRRTQGSLLVAVLYHWSITASAIAAPSAAAEGLPGIASASIGAALIWLAALTLLALRRNDFA